MGLLPFEQSSREVLVRRPFESSGKYGFDPNNRPIAELLEYGIINIDKPPGPTSHQVSAYVQQALGLNKSGHSGTLDPMVTGCLPVALGRGTRIVQSLLVAGKEYIGILHLHQEFSRKKLDEVFERFRGTIKQMPPVKSAVKRRWRERTIYYLEILDVKDQDVLFVAGTQAGTYIRKLCHDIGAELGGGHMTELRRTKAGPFNESTLVTLQFVRDAYHYWKQEGREDMLRKAIQPIEFGVSHLPHVWVNDSAVDALCNGASLKAPGIVKLNAGIEPNKIVAVVTLKGELIFSGNAVMTSERMLNEDHGVAVRPQQVFMKPGTYPKQERGA
jgi:H/ACA ribonucleoprotein complex subunit 4